MILREKIKESIDKYILASAKHPFIMNKFFKKEVNRCAERSIVEHFEHRIIIPFYFDFEDRYIRRDGAKITPVLIRLKTQWALATIHFMDLKTKNHLTPL